MRTTTACLMLALVLAGQLAAETPAKLKYEPTSDYTRQNIHGWPVYVNNRLLNEKKELGNEALELLRVKLYEINRAVPRTTLERLHKIPIWMEYKDRRCPCACYHPSKEWLTANGYNPEKARSVEIANAATFLNWTHIQPSMVLHELAHAYHHQVLGHGHPGIRAAYKHACQSKSYEAVLHYAGKTGRAYAMNNPKEYFAELTEAWFGTNDFFPFVRPEVIQHDPQMAKVLENVWGCPDCDR